MKKKILCVAGVVLLAAVAARTQDQPTSQPSAQQLQQMYDRSCILLCGEAQLTSGQATITLPSWYQEYTNATGRTVLLTCKGGWSPLWASAVSNGQFTVSTNGSGNNTQAFCWMVSSKRGSN